MSLNGKDGFFSTGHVLEAGVDGSQEGGVTRGQTDSCLLHQLPLSVPSEPQAGRPTQPHQNAITLGPNKAVHPNQLMSVGFGINGARFGTLRGMCCRFFAACWVVCMNVSSDGYGTWSTLVIAQGCLSKPTFPTLDSSSSMLYLAILHSLTSSKP